MEGIFNFRPNVASLFLTLGSWRWYVLGSYVLPNDEPTALEAAPKRMEVVLIGYLNAWLRELQGARDEDIVATLADCGMVDMIAHFTLRRKYRGQDVVRGI